MKRGEVSLTVEVVLSQFWWIFLIKALVALIFGILFLAWPGRTLLALFVLFGIFALTYGFFDVIRAIVLAIRKERWGMVMAMGLVDILIGLILLTHTTGSAAFVLFFFAIIVGVLLIAGGIMDLVSAFETRPKTLALLLGISGLLSIIVGILFIVETLATFYAIMILLGIYLLATGILLIFRALYVRRAYKEYLASQN